LKWAGGKRQLLAQLRRFYPTAITRYVEPFVGSGAVFFDLCACGRLSGADSGLSDENADLIGTYLRVADSTDAVLHELRQLAAGHQCGDREHYYDVRDRRFNPQRQQWRDAGGSAADYPARLAAMLLYLNRTGYNGLFRLNAKGHFNVPAGSYSNPAIVNEDRIRAAAAALRSPRVHLSHAPFETTLADVARGDFVYLDPPYAPLSPTANFRSYTARGFIEADQKRLCDGVLAIAARGVHVLLSNSTAASVVALYDNRTARAAGLRCYRVPARRAINSRGSERGIIEELVVTTLPRRDTGT
jgi:DNA adenine methylase